MKEAFEVQQGKEIKAGDYTFQIRGADFTDHAAALAWARREGFDLGPDNGLEHALIGKMVFIRRITGWDVEDSKGEKVPCTAQNKFTFFGKHHNLVNELVIEEARQEGLELKNSKTSQSGEEVNE